MSHDLGLLPVVLLSEPDDDGRGGVVGGNSAGQVDCVSSPASHLTDQSDVVGPSYVVSSYY